MAFVTKTVKIESDWLLVTNKVAMLQFNDTMHMALTSGEVPTETVGFVMKAGEKYVNSSSEVSVYAKSLRGGTAIESVRVAEWEA